MTVRQALERGASCLRNHRCDGADPVRESEALLAHALGLTQPQLFLAYTKEISAARSRAFDALVGRRAKHTPLAWLLGTAWFMDHEFLVNEHALIPRPATEHVVEAAVAAARAETAVAEAVDVGTGSGCIAVSLALLLPQTRIWATDTSIPAFAIARRNARKHGVFSATPAAGHVTIRKANVLGYEPTHGHASMRPLPFLPEGTALIAANLPYVPTAMRASISKCVLAEPASALFSGRDGLDASRALVRQLATLHAKLPNKKIIAAFEILARQFAPLAADMRRAFPSALVEKPIRIKNYHGTTVGLLATIAEK